MDQVPEMHQGNPERPNPGRDLVKGCERLLQRYADFTEVTGEKGFYPKGGYDESYRSLGLEHFPPSGLGQTPAHDDPIREGEPPFLDTRFPFTVSQRRDNNHPDLESLPKLKVILPIDSRGHFGHGRVEYFLDEDGQWRAVSYDRRPAFDALKAQIKSGGTGDGMEAITDLMNAYNDSEENAELEKSMGMAREASEDELKALTELMKDPQVIRSGEIGRHFKGIFSILDSREMRNKMAKEKIKEHSNPEAINKHMIRHQEDRKEKPQNDSN